MPTPYPTISLLDLKIQPESREGQGKTCARARCAQCMWFSPCRHRYVIHAFWITFCNSGCHSYVLDVSMVVHTACTASNIRLNNAAPPPTGTDGRTWADRAGVQLATLGVNLPVQGEVGAKRAQGIVPNPLLCFAREDAIEPSNKDSVSLWHLPQTIELSAQTKAAPRGHVREWAGSGSCPAPPTRPSM